MAVRQQALVNGVDCGLGAEPLAHRRLGRVWQIGILQAQRMVAEMARGSDQRLGLGERERHALVARDGLAEGDALLHVGPALVERGLRRAEHLKADQRAAEIEPLHHLHEALPLVGEPPRCGHDDIVEEDRAAADGMAAQIPVALGRDARRAHWDQERADAARLGLDRPRPCEQYDRIGLIGHADR